MLVPEPTFAPTPTFYKRATSSESASSSSSSSACTGKNANSAQCEKPASSNGLEIGLGVGIPVAAIMLILGLFIFRNYRKEKRESKEYDPDFDENGDPTVLPDFPSYAKENPFRPDNSMVGANGGYPLRNLPARHSAVPDLKERSQSSETISVVPSNTIDGFVLPYHNQMGSKASLDEYARQIGDRSFGHQRRLSERSEFSVPAKSPVKASSNVPNRSPVKSALAPTRLQGSSYEAIPNASAVQLGYPDNSRSNQDFGITYENELLSLENSQPLVMRNGAPYSHPNGSHHSSDIVSINDSDNEEFYGYKGKMGTAKPAHMETTMTSVSLSPFEDKNEVSFSRKLMEAKQESFDEDEQDSASPKKTLNSKVPRMSAFNMLENISDDEDDSSAKQMTLEQAEELARMKSVYKVYFGKETSGNHPEADSTAFQADKKEPLPKLEGLMPQTVNKRATTSSSLYEKSVNILDSDVFEDRSVKNSQAHEEQPSEHQGYGQPSDYQGSHTGHYNQYQEGYGTQEYGNEYQPEGYYQQYQGQQGNEEDYSQGLPHHLYQPGGPGYDLQYDMNQQVELPLRSLPHASQIRNSTIETFTNFQPRPKVTSPVVKSSTGHFDHQGNGHVYNGYGGNNPDVPPMIHSQNDHSGAVPSASQLSRKSVVMLNPVTEITSHRKFKPAGGLPSGMNVPHGNQNIGDDLIPGNRKSAVRKMMNSNF